MKRNLSCLLILSIFFIVSWCWNQPISDNTWDTKKQDFVIQTQYIKDLPKSTSIEKNLKNCMIR